MTTNVNVSFPGLGIKNIDIDPVVFRPFGVEIRWYALIICIGIICAFFYFYRRAIRTEKLLEDDVLNITLLAVPLAIVGARFLYVITNLNSYDSFFEMINIREGGLAIYGGIIFGALTMFAYTKIKRLPTFKFLDAIAPAVLIGQIIGRWGNFMNGEAFGEEYGAASLPWRMELVNTYDSGVVKSFVTHPTFLYESLWNLLGFVLINLLYKKKRFDGQIFLAYVAWYGFGRGLIEILRSDSLLVFGQKLMVYLGLLTCATAIAIYVVLLRRAETKTDEVAEFLQAKNATEENTTEDTENDNT